MDGGSAQRVRRWLLRIWIGYAAVWIVWWAYRLTVGGGLESPSEVVTLVISGTTGLLGLVSGWLARREDPATG
jgi:hypothetical protein